MSKSGQSQAAVNQGRQERPETREYIVELRCLAKKGCQMDAFYYELNQRFTTRLVVTPKMWEKHVAPVIEVRRKKGESVELDWMEIVNLVLPEHLELMGEGRVENLPPTIQQQIDNPPRPGQDRAMRTPLSTRIREACQTLDHAKEHHWDDDDGGPSAVVVSDRLGVKVDREQIRAAVPRMKRRTLQDRPASS